MTPLYDVAAIGNAIVDVIAPATDAFLAEEGLVKGSMTLIDEDAGRDLYSRMAAAIETSGGSAGNTVAGVASLGGRAVYIGKLGVDQLGDVFMHDLDAIGARFAGGRMGDATPTGRSLINVTPDGQRTMATCLGAAVLLSAEDVEPAVIEAAAITYLEGYLFDPEPARRAFAKAAGLARAADRLIALSLSDSFVAERHRDALIAFIDTQVDILFANEAEIISLYQAPDFDTAVQITRGRAKIAALTRSERGSLILAGDAVHQIEAARAEKVVDTTGAGDQYAAGFLFGLSQGRSLDVCGRLGSLAAAEVISHYGPRPQVSLRDLAAASGL